MLPTNALALQVPQLQEMSDVLQATTGWSIRPVAGLMHPRDFLAGFAFKVRWYIAVLVVHSAHITPALTCVATFSESTHASFVHTFACPRCPGCTADCRPSTARSTCATQASLRTRLNLTSSTS